MTWQQKNLAAALVTLVLSLMLVGAISGTVLRHAVQVIPAIVAILLVLRGHPGNRMASMPILAFWLLIMILIWLTVTRVAKVVSGRFTTSEVILTVVMGVACAVGLLASWRLPRDQGRVMGLATFVIFGALQVGVMLLSFTPALANR